MTIFIKDSGSTVYYTEHEVNDTGKDERRKHTQRDDVTEYLAEKIRRHSVVTAPRFMATGKTMNFGYMV